MTIQLRTIDDGNFNIILKATMKTPYPKLKRTVAIDGNKADVVAVTAKITCEKDGHTFKGYQAYILKDITK
jgi:hypothetical protein